MTSELLVRPKILGPVHSPISPFVNMTDPSGKGFTNVVLPGFPGVWCQNINFSGFSEAHETMGTARDEPQGSTHYVAFRWLYQKSSDLIQTGRNLIYQVQMRLSPALAISPQFGKLDFVWRNPTLQHRDPLGPIPWGHVMHFVLGIKIAKADGFVVGWYEVDGWPDLNAAPDHAHSKINTDQGDIGHDTVGQYGEHAKPGFYKGFWDVFARAATPQRALALATS